MISRHAQLEFYDHSNQRLVCHDGVTCNKDTDKAILCELENSVEFWIPKSMVDDESEVYEEGTSGVLVIKRWIAEQNGWI
jgi:hypothetical protein